MKRNANSAVQDIDLIKQSKRETRQRLELSKYRPEFPRLLEMHLSQGWSLGSFGGVVNVNNQTLYAWVRNFKEFKDVADKYNKLRKIKTL